MTAAKNMAAATAAALGNGKGPDVDFRALLRSARLPERTVPICLRGDLVGEFEDLDRQLAEEVEKAPADKRLGQRPPGHETAEKMAALRDQMAASTVVFRLRALPRPIWVALMVLHPPRKGEDGRLRDDDSLGVNIDTFFEPLLRASIIYPELDAELWEILMGRGVPTEDDPDADKHGLTARQFDSLAGPAWSLNRSEVDIPFSRAAYRILRNFEPE